MNLLQTLLARLQQRRQPVIAAEYPAQELPAAFDHLARGPFGKVVLNFP